MLYLSAPTACLLKNCGVASCAALLAVGLDCTASNYSAAAASEAALESGY